MRLTLLAVCVVKWSGEADAAGRVCCGAVG